MSLKLWSYRWYVILILVHFCIFISPVFAGTDGKLSQSLSQQLMCQFVTAFKGNAGLFAGLVLAMWGLFLIIKKSKVFYGLFIIIIGALVTALPSMLASFLLSVDAFVQETHLADSKSRTQMINAFKAFNANCGKIIINTDLYDYTKFSNGQYDDANRMNNPNAAGVIGRGGPSGANGNSVNGSPGSSACNNTTASNGPVACSTSVLSGGPYRITSSFGFRPKDGRNHNGLDFGAAQGVGVLAYQSGNVSFVGWKNGYGNRVEISHANGTHSTYNHLSAQRVRVGQAVSSGQQIGLVGNTGASRGAHLHFEVIGSNGSFMDPSDVMGCGVKGPANGKC